MKLNEIKNMDKKLEITDLSLINQLIKDKWKYGAFTIIETYRDTFVYMVRDSDNYKDMTRIEYVIYNWKEQEKKRIEKENAESGNANIIKYFQKYGVIHQPHKTGHNSYYSNIIYDCKATPDYNWNSKIFMKSVRVNKQEHNNYYNRFGFVNEFSIEFSEKNDPSIDATIDKNGIPRIRHSHNWYDNIHNELETHYTNKKWSTDLNKAIELHIKQVDELIDENEEIIYSTRSKIFYQKSKNYVCLIIGSNLHQMEIISDGKYRNLSIEISKFPKFNSTITKKEILDGIRDSIKEEITNKKFDEKFLTTSSSTNFNPMTGRPGYSRHHYGIAFDISTAGGKNAAYKWLEKNALAFGFIRTVKSETWHWEYKPWEILNIKEWDKYARVPKSHSTWNTIDEDTQVTENKQIKTKTTDIEINEC